MNFLILKFHMYPFLISCNISFSPSISKFLFFYFTGKKHACNSLIQNFIMVHSLVVNNALGLLKTQSLTFSSYLKHIAVTHEAWPRNEWLSLDALNPQVLVDYVGKGSDSHFLLKIPHFSSTDFKKGRDLTGEFDEAN